MTKLEELELALEAAEDATDAARYALEKAQEFERTAGVAYWDERKKADD